MDNRPDIWQHLKDHEAVPPAELRQRLLLILDTLAVDHAAENGAMEDRAIFQRLLEHTISPPAEVSGAITAAIKSVHPPKPTRRTYLPYTAAAACILLIMLSVSLYRGTASHGTHKGSLVAIKPATPAASAIIPTKSAQTAKSDSSVNISAVQAEPLQLSLAADGDQLSLVDNNILATFVDYKYPALKNFVEEEKADATIRIHLDQYTDITLSPAMTATLKTLYDTRPDGTPDRRARKTREKLGKWEARDKKQFDAHPGSNPLDPIDLGEFIFPPFFSFGRHSAHTALADTSPPASQAQTTHSQTTVPLTISYSLTLLTPRANNNMAETYNGGMQTLFDDGDHARLRLASLMRIQSIFLPSDRQTVTMLAESAKPQLKTVLTADQWLRYNAKYANATCDLTADTGTILGYPCKKALITLHDGRKITAWYTPRIQEPAQSVLEPAFAAIPGLVLRYQYTCRRKTLRYTAATVSRRPIDPTVFNLP
ncbi:MAG TPA: hypothetical protein VG605_12805 [Puia sp.]|nr:hypothetical protein [Puia sp.]